MLFGPGVVVAAVLLCTVVLTDLLTYHVPAWEEDLWEILSPRTAAVGKRRNERHSGMAGENDGLEFRAALLTRFRLLMPFLFCLWFERPVCVDLGPLVLMAVLLLLAGINNGDPQRLICSLLGSGSWLLMIPVWCRILIGFVRYGSLAIAAVLRSPPCFPADLLNALIYLSSVEIEMRRRYAGAGSSPGQPDRRTNDTRPHGQAPQGGVVRPQPPGCQLPGAHVRMRNVRHVSA